MRAATWAAAGTAVLRLDSPLGPLELEADERGLTSIRVGAPPSRKRARSAPQAEATLRLTARALERYFAGDVAAYRKLLDALPMNPSGTDFERAAWRALGAVPLGTVTGYGEIARRIGRAGAARAVGRSMGRNPIPILVPCHRVVGADGRLVGYTGGLARKRWLLAHEQRMATGMPRSSSTHSRTNV